MVPVKRLLQSDITKLLVYFALTLAGAAAVSPLLFNLGKFIAEVGETRNLNVVMNWIAQKCAHEEFGYFFKLSLLLCALCLAAPLVSWMRLENAAADPPVSPWRIRLPKHSTASDHGQPLRHNRHGWLHLATGFLLAGSLLTLMVWLLLVTGWFRLEQPDGWLGSLGAALATALLVATVSEWVFRGALLGIFLRSMRPAAALVAVSLVFTAVHFLMTSKGIALRHPDGLDAGFRMLGQLGTQLTNPQVFLPGSVPAFFAGMILAYARYRTASLWLPVGLHAGWLFVHLLFLDLAVAGKGSLPLMQVMIGNDRLSGVLPLCLLVTTGVLVHVFVQISGGWRKLETS